MSILIADQRIISLREAVLERTDFTRPRTVDWLIAGDAKYGEEFWLAERDGSWWCVFLFVASIRWRHFKGEAISVTPCSEPVLLTICPVDDTAL